MIRNFLYLTCIMFTFSLHSQVNTHLNFGVSHYTVEGVGPSFPQGWDIYSSPRLGLEMKYDSFPLSLSYSYNFLAIVTSINSSSIFHTKYRTHSLELLWKPKKVTFGLGHYWYRSQNLLDLSFPFFDQEFRGISLSSSIILDKITFQVRRNIDYAPFLRVLDDHLTSFNLFYKLRDRESTNKESGIESNIYLTLNAYPFSKNDSLQSAPKASIGGELEFLIKKYNLSFNLSRDWHMNLIAGVPNQKFNSFIKTSTVNIFYHFPFRVKYLKFGVGGVFISDLGIIGAVRRAYFFNGEDVDLFYVNVKGINCSIDYPISKSWLVELRQIFPLRGESTFTARRSSLNLKYKF